MFEVQNQEVAPAAAMTRQPEVNNNLYGSGLCLKTSDNANIS